MTLSQRIAQLTGPDRAVDAEVAVAQSDIHRHGSYEAARQAMDRDRVVAAMENG